MATGLTLQESLRVVAALSAGDGAGTFHQRFQDNPAAALAELGIDGAASLGTCAVLAQPLPSARDLAAMHDMMVGRLLTAHASHNIHDPQVS
jgi:putative modified peptide